MRSADFAATSTTVNDCAVIELPIFKDHRGSLCFAEAQKQVPFAIERIFYQFDIPEDQVRGRHGHRRSHQFLLALAGRVRLQMDDGFSKREVVLNKPNQGLWVPPGIWLVMDRFAPGAVVLVCASEKYDEAEYLRDYPEFQLLKKSAGTAAP